MEPKSKDQLIQELRERVYALEEIESDRDAIERELKSTRQRLQHLLAVSPAIIYTTKASGDFACTYVSENLQAIMGYTPEQMTTDPKCWPDHLHPEDARRILDECPRLVERGKGTLEYRFRRREGGYIWILDTFRVVYDDAGRPLELVGAWADITDGKHAEQAALEAKRYLARLIESSTDAIISTDKEGKIVLVNEGAEKLLGYQAKDLIGQPVTAPRASPGSQPPCRSRACAAARSRTRVPRASRSASAGCSQMPMVRSPCTLLCPRTGHSARARPADVAAQQQEVHDLLNVGDAVLVLRQPHGPAADHALALDRDLGRLADLLARQPALRRRSRPSAACPALRTNSSNPSVCCAMKAWSSTSPGRRVPPPASPSSCP